jgi:hypothetical protein
MKFTIRDTIRELRLTLRELFWVSDYRFTIREWFALVLVVGLALLVVRLVEADRMRRKGKPLQQGGQVRLLTKLGQPQPPPQSPSSP